MYLLHALWLLFIRLFYEFYYDNLYSGTTNEMQYPAIECPVAL